MSDILCAIATAVFIGLSYYGGAMLGLWLSEKWWYRKPRGKKKGNK